MAIKHPVLNIKEELSSVHAGEHAGNLEKRAEERIAELEEKLAHSKALPAIAAYASRAKASFIVAVLVGVMTFMAFTTACLMALFGNSKDIATFIGGVSPILMVSLGALLVYAFGHHAPPS